MNDGVQKIKAASTATRFMLEWIDPIKTEVRVEKCGSIEFFEIIRKNRSVIYIRNNNHKRYKAKEVADGVFIDYDKKGKIVGIEIL